MELIAISTLFIFFLSILGIHICTKLPNHAELIKILKFFFVFMGLSAFHGIIYVYLFSGDYDILKGSPLGLVYGPFLYFTFDTIHNKKTITNQKVIKHLLPLILWCPLYVIYSFDSNWRACYFLNYHIALYGVVFLSCLVYSFYIFFTLSHTSNPDRASIMLLSAIVILFWVYCLYLGMAIYTVHWKGGNVINTSTFAFITIVRAFVVLLVFLRVLQLFIQELTFEKTEHVIKGKGEYLISNKSKYLHSQISMDSLYEFVERFEKLMLQDQYYLNPDLSLSKVALQIKIPSYQLTQVLSRAYGMSLQELINRMRIEYACQLMCKNPNISLSELVVQSGYTSESTFFRNFRAIVGGSPTQFKQAVLSK